MSQMEMYRASDGRPIGMVVRHDFDDFASHPPTFENDIEREWLANSYQVESPELERETKAHITPDELPLQITVLNRRAGALVKPHYHTNDELPRSDTRHQVMVCLTGRARIGLFAKEGEHVGDVDLEPGDFILMYEGHSIETLQDGTRLVEVKQGPMPADPRADNMPLGGAQASVEA